MADPFVEEHCVAEKLKFSLFVERGTGEATNILFSKFDAAGVPWLKDIPRPTTTIKKKVGVRYNVPFHGILQLFGLVLSNYNTKFFVYEEGSGIVDAKGEYDYDASASVSGEYGPDILNNNPSIQAKLFLVMVTQPRSELRRNYR